MHNCILRGAATKEKFVHKRFIRCTDTINDKSYAREKFCGPLDLFKCRETFAAFVLFASKEFKKAITILGKTCKTVKVLYHVRFVIDGVQFYRSLRFI